MAYKKVAEISIDSPHGGNLQVTNKNKRESAKEVSRSQLSVNDLASPDSH